MSLVILRDASTPLPSPAQALSDPAGLLAIGHDIGPARLEEAYSKGIFPWFGPGQPVLWWSPDPRMVLRPADFSVHRSLAKRIRQLTRRHDLEIRVDHDLGAVLRACAAPRQGSEGTWIVPELQQAYLAWARERGRVHSVETWLDGQLVGGLYAVAIGRAVFGESMFTRIPDASKIALHALVSWLKQQEVRWIDCQQETEHLASLGAAPIARSQFLRELVESIQGPELPWPSGGVLPLARHLPGSET
jgi:leucyl/phenylalanyl-tRNA--protein transferase